jgi:hypothetical protein
MWFHQEGISFSVFSHEKDLFRPLQRSHNVDLVAHACDVGNRSLDQQMVVQYSCNMLLTFNRSISLRERVVRLHAIWRGGKATGQRVLSGNDHRSRERVQQPRKIDRHAHRERESFGSLVFPRIRLQTRVDRQPQHLLGELCCVIGNRTEHFIVTQIHLE